MTVRSQWLGDSVKGQMRAAAAAGLLDAANAVRARSQPLAPREFGELAASAETDVDKSTLIAAVSYDVDRFPKILKQHEDLTYRHPRGGQAKFLEEPLYASASQVQAALARALDQGLR